MALDANEYNSDELKWNDRTPRLQHRFLVLRKLGQGTYGKVQLALNKETNQEVAIKTIKKARIENEEDMLRIRREIHIMTSIRHPHIIHIYEVFETRQKIVIVMQYASGGELYDYLGCHQTLPEDEARRIFRQITSAIYYCHKNQICHRDLKLENILLDEAGNAQIADFGLSNIFDEKRRMTTFCGSPLYASPEIVKGTPYKGPEVDCWSLGVLLYTLIYGTMPFDGRNFKDLVSQISEGRYEEPVVKSNASGLIRRLLTPEISRRATIKDVCTDNWVNQGYETSLLKEAENMALVAGLQRERFRVAKICLETNMKHGREKTVFQKNDTLREHNAAQNHNINDKTVENGKNSLINHYLEKSSLYEQITNYDVRFVINKLIATVEASLSNVITDENIPNVVAVAKDKIISSKKLKKINGETTVSDKVNSEYVIPIFEVTSVIPKYNERKEVGESRNFQLEKIRVQKEVPNKFDDKSKESCSKNLKATSMSAESQNVPNNKTLLHLPSVIISQNCEDSSKACDSVRAKNLTINKGIKDKELANQANKQLDSLNAHNDKTCQNCNLHDKLCNEHNSLSRRPSPKLKRMHDNLLLGQKHSGPFIRTRNQAFSLARILSLQYEKLMRNSFKSPGSKKKPPGKITIPPTFDPTVLPNTDTKKKEIIVFPTVSVVENKEKIEKKIEKIKKAALDRKLIIRSDSKSKLKIEKYLKKLYEARKMQNMAPEEQKNIDDAIEHLKKQKAYLNLSEACCFMKSKRSINSFMRKAVTDELFCFLCPKPHPKISEMEAVNANEGIQQENDEMQLTYEEICNNCHICGLKKMMREQEEKLGLPSVTKSKSEIKIPYQYFESSSAQYSISDSTKLNVEEKSDNSQNIANINSFLNVIPLMNIYDSNKKILRSLSDSAGLHASFKNIENRSEENNLTAGEENDSESQEQIQCSDKFDFDYNGGHSNNQNQKSKKKYSLKHLNGTHTSGDEQNVGDGQNLYKYIDLHNRCNGENQFIARCKSMHDSMRFADESVDDNHTPIMKRLSSEPYLADDYLRHEYFNREEQDLLYLFNSSESGVPSEGDIRHEQKKGKRGELRRRNTMTCVNGERNNFRKLRDSEFEAYIWNLYKKHELLLTDPHSEAHFSSSPNLENFPFERKDEYRNTSKSVDYLNEDKKYLSDAFLSASGQELGEMDFTSMRKAKNHPNYSKSFYERSSARGSRTKSISDETLSQKEREDIIRRLKAERKISAPHAHTIEESYDKTMQFHSHFLNDLEIRDQISNMKERKPVQRRSTRNSFSFGKRSKADYNTKSFLQLLALKRIQEAQKELEKSERNNMNDIEEENSGTLLEALKTHGYKAVISQRFQGAELDEPDSFLRYPSNSFLPRNFRTDFSSLNFMHYSTLPRYSIGAYDFDDLDNVETVLNGLSTTSLYEMQHRLKQKAPKQFIYDWLATNDTAQYLPPIKREPDFLFTLEEDIVDGEVGRCCAQWGKENASSLDKDSAPESYEIEENQINSPLSNDHSKIRNYSYDYIEPRNYSKSERTRLHTSSANSDDERQESVQDRIWRKSFYSRFNNSALSRKERSSFLESDHLSESRTGFINSLYPPSFKTAGLDRNEGLSWEESNKTIQAKRSNSFKKYSPSPDKFGSSSSMKSKLAKLLKKEKLFNTDNKNVDSNVAKIDNSFPNEVYPTKSDNFQNEDSEPEH